MNKELILKYLSGLLSDKEKSDFENRLKTDPEFSREYEKITGGLESLKYDSTAETNEKYFINLIPRFHSKKERKAKWNYFPQISFALTLFIALYFLIFYGYSNNLLNFNFDFSQLSDTSLSTEINEYFNNPIDEEFLYLYSIESNEDTLNTIGFDLQESDIESIEFSIYSFPSVDDYEFLNQMDEEDFTELKETLEQIKI